MHHHVRRIDKLICQHLSLAISLLLITVLRLPNFFEPYWYGDEGIYLTLGTAMRQGERLYLEIIDHKTPLIYYLAMVPTQFWFRVLLFVVMCAATVLFYLLASKIFRSRWAVNISMWVFVLLTTLPAFEGNIPNGELFVMFFILAGSYFFSRTTIFQEFFTKQRKLANDTRSLFLGGVLFSLAILTKVPAVLDVAAFFAIYWFVFLADIPTFMRSTQKWRSVAALTAGVLTPILFSILYFVLRGSGKAYLDYGLLYNFRYADSWKLDFHNSVLNTLFTLKGKLLVLIIWVGLISLSRRFLSPTFTFLATWFGFALFATLLSNRPYPHYYLQVFPPFSLLCGYLVQVWSVRWKQPMMQRVMHTVGISLSIAAFLAVLSLLQVGLYPTASYYARFAQLLTGQISATAYQNSFNPLMADNYAAAKIIRSTNEKKMFIWGTNPMLYALAQKAPVGRFTVAFHIKDFHAEAETLQAITKSAPKFIVVMNEESELPGLNMYLQGHYIPNITFEHFVLWKRIER